MTTFAVTDPDHTIDAINYLLSNLDINGGTGNVVIPGNVLVANTTTGVVSQYGNTAVFGYLYQYVNLRYSNNSTGGSGSFSTTPTNLNYFGVFNSITSTPSANPTDYQWYEVAGGFGTTKILYYSAFGGRQVAWAAANSAPSSNYVASVANVAIDLDVVTTAAGTPGERGPVVMAGVIATADPNFATSSTLTLWFEAPRDSLTAPIGTGLTPVVGDTASFTYAAGAGQPQAAYSYNGSVWVPVDGQVISGNVIVRGTIAGNAMIANTITATQIATDTITANNIAGNTITSAKIATGTITAVNIAGNTITGNNIAAGTITTNNFTANTIQGNIIAAGTITATQLAANAITANTVVSTGAVLNNNASLGFWLDGPSGNARFGNSISIGNQLTVGSGANIGAGLIVGSGANIGTNLRVGNSAIIGNSVTVGTGLIVGSNANIGTNLVVGSNANIGANLVVGNTATIGANLIVGANANIGTNLIVGNKASIGGNLFVSGLVTSGSLLANTVATTTIVPAAISSGIGNTTTNSYQINNPTSGVIYYSNTTVALTTVESNQPVYLWTQNKLQVATTPPGAVTVGLLSYLQRVNSANVATTIFSFSDFQTLPSGGTAANFNILFNGFVDTVPTAGTYTYRIGFNWFGAGGSFTASALVFQTRSILAQTLKR